MVELLIVISSPGPKVHVNYCHHLASVVCKLFTFQASSPKPLGRLEPNLAGMFLGWSATKFFFPVGCSTWLPGPIICSDLLKFQIASSLNLKLMNWLNLNCKLMIIGMSFTKFLFFMWIGSMGTIAITWRLSSVNFSHFKLLLRNHWANWNQT